MRKIDFLNHWFLLGFFVGVSYLDPRNVTRVNEAMDNDFCRLRGIKTRQWDWWRITYIQRKTLKIEQAMNLKTSFKKVNSTEGEKSHNETYLFSPNGKLSFTRD